MWKTKHIRRIMSVALAFSAALFLVSNAIGADPEPAKVTYVKKSVHVQRAKGAKVALKKGDTLRAGDRITTGKKSRIEIRFVDNSAIRLGSKSDLLLKESMFGGSTKNVEAKLVKGKAYAMVSKLVGKESSFKIKTGTAVAGVRGTAFRINAKRDNSTVVRVYTGAVAVSNAPLYAKPGKTKEASNKFVMPRKGVKPGGPGRVVVAGPKEVTKKEWEEFVAKAMQEVRVSADGKVSAPVAFDSNKDAEDEWVAWNKSMDDKLPE